MACTRATPANIYLSLLVCRYRERRASARTFTHIAHRRGIGIIAVLVMSIYVEAVLTLLARGDGGGGWALYEADTPQTFLIFAPGAPPGR